MSTVADQTPLSDSRLANLGARLISDAYGDLERRFRIVTRRARIRFRERDWAGMAADATERLDLYEASSEGGAEAIAGLLGDRSHDKMVWAGMKAVYSGMIQGRDEWELAETFFNSVTRKIFTTVGVDPRIEFVDTDYDAPPAEAETPLHRSYESVPLPDLVSSVLVDADLGVEFAHLESDAEDAAAKIADHLRSIGALRVVDRTEIIDAVFYRGKRAYIIGRMYSGLTCAPGPRPAASWPGPRRRRPPADREPGVDPVFVHPLLLPRGRRPLVGPDPLSAHAHAAQALAELYICLGHNKHGKTELYRELRAHIHTSGDALQIARGRPGMVMVVFTLPGFDVVFKVIKDRFPPGEDHHPFPGEGEIPSSFSATTGPAAWSTPGVRAPQFVPRDRFDQEACSRSC